MQKFSIICHTLDAWVLQEDWLLGSRHCPTEQQQTGWMVPSDWFSKSSSAYTYLHIRFLLIKLKISGAGWGSGSPRLSIKHTQTLIRASFLPTSRWHVFIILSVFRVLWFALQYICSIKREMCDMVCVRQLWCLLMKCSKGPVLALCLQKNFVPQSSND